jgi:hypothetical protein
MLHGVHQSPSLFMACADAGRVAAGERLRTGVNEPRTEPTPCHAAWPTGRVPVRLATSGLFRWRVVPPRPYRPWVEHKPSLPRRRSLLVLGHHNHLPRRLPEVLHPLDDPPALPGPMRPDPHISMPGRVPALLPAVARTGVAGVGQVHHARLSRTGVRSRAITRAARRLAPYAISRVELAVNSGPTTSMSAQAIAAQTSTRSSQPRTPRCSSEQDPADPSEHPAT